MRKTLSTMSLAAAVVALLSSPAAAQYGSGGSESPRPETPTARPADDMRTQATTPRGTFEKDFIEEAAASGMAEVRLGDLAQQKASNAEVKQFAQQLVKEHTKANSELEQIAAAQNVTPPQELKSKHQKAYDKLSKLSGDEFDKAFVKQMVQDHQAAVKLFERGSKNVTDPQVKQFASSTLPKLQNHLEEARRLQDDVKRSSGARGTTGTAGTAGEHGEHGEHDQDRDRDQDQDRDREHAPGSPTDQTPRTPDASPRQ